MSELNFKVNKNIFYNALVTVSKVVSSNSPVPALSGIKLDVYNNEILITGSDANLSIQVKLNNSMNENLNLAVVEEGTIVIDSKYLLEIVRKIDADSIKIEIIDGTLTHFAGNKAEFKINGFRSEDYPTIDFSTPSTTFEMSSTLMTSIINETSFAASNKETRPVLTGINLKAENNKLVCTATDSYRLSRKIVEINSEDFNITVPARTMNEIKSIFSNEENLSVSLNTKKIQINSSNILFQSNLLDGGYPETDRLIPKTFSNCMVIRRSDIISAIDRTSFIKTDNMTIIRLQMNSTDDINVTNKSQEIGESHEDLVAESYEGEPLGISFAGNYVVDAVKALSSDNIKMQFNGEMKPFILTNEDGDESLLQLVLPVRTYN